MGKRLLIANRRLALAPGSRRVVLFDPVTGKGAECCCGSGGGPCSGVCGSAANAIGRCDGGTVCTLDATTGTPVEATRWRFDFSGSGSTISQGFPTTSWSASGSVELGWVVDGNDCAFRILSATGSQTYTANGNPPIVTPYTLGYWYDFVPDRSILFLNQFRLRDFAGKAGAFNLEAFRTFGDDNKTCNRTYTEGTAPDQIRWTRTYSSTCGGGAMAANFTTIPIASFRGSINFSCGITLVENCAAPVRSCQDWLDLWLAQDPSADLNGDGIVDAIDYDEIVRRYCV